MSESTLAAASQALDDGQIDGAIIIYQALIDQGEADALSARFGLAVCAARRKQWEDAETHLQAVIAQAPDFAVAHAYLGTVRLNLGQITAAEAAFATAMQLGPGNAVVRLKYAEMLLRIGRLPDAATELQRAGALPSSDKTVTTYIRLLNQSTKKELKHAIIRNLPDPGEIWQRVRHSFAPTKPATTSKVRP